MRLFSPGRFARFAPLAVVAFLAACQATPPELMSGAASRPGDDSALSTMERIAVSAQKCWFGGRDPAFRGLAMSPELTSHSGAPRMLAVPRGNIGGLPSLVVEARGKPARLSAFGPVMTGPYAGRVAADIQRWSRGQSDCASA